MHRYLFYFFTGPCSTVPPSQTPAPGSCLEWADSCWGSKHRSSPFRAHTNYFLLRQCPLWVTPLSRVPACLRSKLPECGEATKSIAVPQGVGASERGFPLEVRVLFLLKICWLKKFIPYPCPTLRS